MATRGRFFGDYFFPGEDEQPEPTEKAGGGEIPPGYDDPLGPSPEARDRAIAAPNPYDHNPNPMLRQLGLPPSPFDFLTGSAGRVHPGAVVGGAGSGAQGAPRPGGMGTGRGPANVDITSFFGGPPESGGLSPDEYLAQQRGTTLQALQTKDLSQDAGFRAAVEAEAQRRMADQRTYGVNALNPIQASLMRQRVLADPEFRRQYTISTFGYDPRTGRMIRPQGFDPMTDQGFLTASNTLAAQRRGLRESALEALYGPQYRERQQQAQLASLIGFFGLPQ